MPELAEEMYCSQQICIPPTFPYLLRQFAKAAIRTQPNDLLKWATAYFRCLSLNIPPPVKPRLEYPVPKDHLGITPGWLKALLFQLQGAETVSFKLLWDRWIGACLQHNNLIQILCLGGFTDNTAVPWLRFIALCAGFLSDNLTQTMILICEILTDEPEGGSAMIRADTFIDLYRFLAQIDASFPQTLKNYYFLDKFLDLFREKIQKDEGLGEEVEEIEPETEAVSSEASTMRSEEETKKEEDGTSVVSCPSVPSDEQDNYLQLLQKVQEDDMEEEMEAMERDKALAEAAEVTETKSEASDQDKTKDKDVCSLVESPPISATEAAKKIDSDEDLSEEKVEAAPKSRKKCLEEDLERLKKLHNEILRGESDDELEKYKASLIAEMHLTESQLKASIHYETKIDSIEDKYEMKEVAESDHGADDLDKEQEPEYEEVFVEAVPGIGRKIPEEMINIVCEYVEEQAKLQHGMIMPRNLRHYDCPPLEILDY